MTHLHSVHGGPALDALGGAELGAAGARVGSDLSLGGRNHAAGHRLERRLVAAGADRLARRADAVARLLRDELLDDAVLERVVADHYEARSKAEQTVSPRQRPGQDG